MNSLITKTIYKKLRYNNVKMLVFDMAGTTVNEGGIVYNTLYSTMKDFNLDVKKDDIHHWHGKNKYEVLEHFLSAKYSKNITGTHGENVADSHFNGGLFQSLKRTGVKATFVGHDHLNDFCALYEGIYLCYNGGSGYNGYGKKGWARRSRIINIENNGSNVYTWKTLYNSQLTRIDYQQIL